MSTTNVSIRMDEDVKRKADELFNELGMTLSTAVNVFVRQALRSGSIPFDIATTPPNPSTLEAILEGRLNARDTSRKRYSSAAELLADLDIAIS